MEDLKTQLSENLAEAVWEWLRPLSESQSVVVVMSGLNLLEVGEALASDQVNLVQRWLTEKMIYKPSPEELALWNDTPSKLFQALIVQPFVLVQEILPGESLGNPENQPKLS